MGRPPKRNGPGWRWGTLLSDFRVRDARKHLEQEQKKRRKCSPRDPEITRVEFQSVCQSIFNLNTNDNAENSSLAGSESSSPAEPHSSSLARPEKSLWVHWLFFRLGSSADSWHSAFENDDQLEHEQLWDSDEGLELDYLDGTIRWLSYRLTPDLVDEYILKLEELGPTPAIESRK